ncbi:flagellar protein FlgN [Fonticella tunisiensis]|uniref:FlgN protein n=1 Tax=Fonticella tunisiensis TaxID=1096341 RepID=A0A4R7K9C0_9CLOT|nr:flagellar protein FlgN [Fonticella tunisiensis]TDT50624.1 FlgN protein [Fonticella tunisiensis]
MELKEIITNQKECLIELNELLDLEKEVLIKDRACEIPEIVEKKKLIAQKMSLLEKERIELCGDKTSSDLIKDGLIDKQTIRTMQILLASAKEKGEMNLMLTRQSLNYIRMIISALSPSKGVITYGNSGKAQDNQKTSIFTTKA